MSAPLRAVVLVSGGLDSATVLALARYSGRECYALSIDYGQRHRAELAAARRVSARLGAHAHRVVTLDFAQFGGSALTDPGTPVPESRSVGIPVTYVPARNTVMLAIALGWAEILSAAEIHIGVNAVDYSGYPDCRPEFIAAFEALARVATKTGVEGCPVRVMAPLLRMSKADIIREGLALGVEFRDTVSCYQANEAGEACGRCDACVLRRDGFRAASSDDFTRYQREANAQ
ncbi:MAG: 7-cyano-7-deazaguanine synthase QueC [Gammaproteobacteria bacterium]